LYQQQALRAADMALVVVQADAASYATIPNMEAVLNAYCHNRAGFGGSAYVLNNVPPGSELSRDVMRVIRAGLGARVAPVIVHQDEAVREALAFDQPVLQYAPHSEATRDISELVAWVDDWIERTQALAGTARP
jgi:cellulose synthase operon protein YhjQ